jgi:hypothetical protein
MSGIINPAMSYYRKPRLTKQQRAAHRRDWDPGRHTPPNIWQDGRQYFPLYLLAPFWEVPYGVASRWAKANPHLTVLWEDRYIFCRIDGGRPAAGAQRWHRPDQIVVAGFVYYSIQALCLRRGTKPHATRAWVHRHLHLAVPVGKRLYCRDEEYYGPHTLRPFIKQDDDVYYSIPELARRRGVDESATRRWAEVRPHLTITQDGRLYARDAEYAPGKKAAPTIIRDGLVYHSLAELAARRQVSHQATRKWAAAHPHLLIQEGRYLFARDEEYQPRHAKAAPSDAADNLQNP